MLPVSGEHTQQNMQLGDANGGRRLQAGVPHKWFSVTETELQRQRQS